MAGTNGSLVSLGLTYTITLTGMLQYCVRLSGEVESVVRLYLLFVSCFNSVG